MNKLYEENRIPTKPQINKGKTQQEQRDSLSERRVIWQSTAPNIGKIVQPFIDNCKHGKYPVDVANDLIRTAINIWVEDNYYPQQKADEIFERLKIR